MGEMERRIYKRQKILFVTETSQKNTKKVKKMKKVLFKRVTRNDRVQMIYNEKLKLIKGVKNREDIVALEYLWGDYYNKKITLDDLFEPNACRNEGDAIKPEILKKLIGKMAGAFYKKKKNASRVTLEDFLSIAYEKAWQTIVDYDYRDEYFLFQQISRNVRNAFNDFLRSQGLTKKREKHRHNAFHKAVEFNVKTVEMVRRRKPLYLEKIQEFENSNILRISLQEAISSLDKQELQVYQLFLNNDNIEKVTLDIICLELGLKYRQQASRIVQRLRKKILNY